MKSENRLLSVMCGDNMGGSMNFIPKMNYQKLKEGYKKIVTIFYSPKQYYKRVKTFLREYKLPEVQNKKLTFREIQAFF